MIKVALMGYSAYKFINKTRAVYVKYINDEETYKQDEMERAMKRYEVKEPVIEKIKK